MDVKINLRNMAVLLRNIAYQLDRQAEAESSKQKVDSKELDRLARQELMPLVHQLKDLAYKTSQEGKHA